MCYMIYVNKDKSVKLEYPLLSLFSIMVLQVLQLCFKGVGVWGGWLPWSQCTGVCGQGTKSRFRLCNDHSNSKYCQGDSWEKVPCRLPQCQPEIQSGRQACKINTNK